MQYCDTSKIIIERSTKEVVYNIIKKKHYAKTWTASSDIYAVYYKSGEHKFFGGDDLKLIGCVIYGNPVGFRVVKSICEELIDIDVLELKRLWIEDDYGKNIESYCISQSFKWLKKWDKDVKVLISYADPDRLHLGGIYKATNWLYQGAGLNLMPNHSISLTKEPYEWIHSRTVSATFGSHNIEKLKAAVGHTFWRRKEPEKHRYIYFIGNKKENKKYMRNLKYELKPYPTNAEEYVPPIDEIEVENRL